ncbi:MAG: ABC transporter ATP-binding protein [Williamsia sp.]|nr:ABC transporter ATP-binding protein [Williamsia sp.]
MISVRNISKKYPVGKGELTAVNQLSFDVAPGELFGIIGPDGAGKTSLFRMLATLLLPDGGEALIGGCHVVKDYKQLRKKLGYMPGRFSLYQDLTVEENLRFFATIFHTSIDENYGLIRDIYEQIKPFKDRRAGKLSGGMKQKLALCCALIHRPTVLLLDEPTTGVDAVSRVEFWQMLQGLKSGGITIIVSTPYMDEASLCDRIALMQQGNFLTTGTPDGIKAAFAKPLLAVKADRMHQLVNAVREAPVVEDSYAFGEWAHAVMREEGHDRELESFLSAKGFRQVVVQQTEPTVEDCFLKLMRP